MASRWLAWTADDYRPILLNRRALVSMVAVVAIALPCFVQDEEKGVLYCVSPWMRLKGTSRRRGYAWSCLGARGPGFKPRRPEQWDHERPELVRRRTTPRTKSSQTPA